MIFDIRLKIFSIGAVRCCRLSYWYIWVLLVVVGIRVHWYQREEIDTLENGLNMVWSLNEKTEADEQRLLLKASRLYLSLLLVRD